MRSVVLHLAAGGFIFVCLVASLSCGQDQKLVSISVTPASFTFSNAVGGETVQFTAIGQFVHPPSTKDLTQQVTWSTPTPDVLTVDSHGLGTVAGVACGTNIPVTATAKTHAGPIPGSATVDVKLAGASC